MQALKVCLLQILFVLTSVEVYSGLQTCVIEGIEPLSNKFQNIFLAIKKKQYDVLDHRKPEFDRDYDEYQKHLFDLEVCSYFHCVFLSPVYLGQYSSCRPCSLLKTLVLISKYIQILFIYTSFSTFSCYFFARTLNENSLQSG